MMRQSSAELSDTPLPQFEGGRHGKSARGSENDVKKRQFQRTTKPKPRPYGLEIDELEALGTQMTAEFSEAVIMGQFKPIVHEDGEEVHEIHFAFSSGRKVLYQRYLNVDLRAPKALQGSKLWSRRDAAMAELQKERGLVFKDDNERNQYLAVSSGLLRSIPDDIIFIAGDRDDNILVYLDPIAVPVAFGNEVKARMERESIRFFSLKKPELNKRDVRHASQQRHRERNGFSQDQCGVDHLGIEHPTGHPTGTIVRTSEFTKLLSDTKRQMYLYYLEDTVGTMSRLLDFQFGFLDPQLRQEYRDVYEASPKFAKLPPTNPDWCPESYTYRAIVVNMQTDYHVDKTDWDRGLVALCQIGKFEGAAMVLRDLGIVLDGYKSGATLQFRGNIFGHYTTEWTGKCRFAFDHTTKNTVRKEVQENIAADDAAQGDSEAADDGLLPATTEGSDRESDVNHAQLVVNKPKRRQADSAPLKRKEAPSDFAPAEDTDTEPPPPTATGTKRLRLNPVNVSPKEASAAEDYSEATD
ncbi:MAG: hypothetical protein Q9211_001818 [Gyalolechia sp. 1 TL-2023]